MDSFGDSGFGSGYDMGSMGVYGMGMGMSSGYGNSSGITSSPQRGYGNDRPEVEPTRILPVTVAQIYNSEDRSGILYFDGVNLKTVAVIGLVIGFEVKTNWSIKIDDGTGAILVNAYPDSERIKNLQEKINGGVWIRVIGRARKDEKKVTIFGLHLEIIEDYNMVLYHHFHVVLAHERNQTGLLPPNPGQGYGVVKTEMSVNDMNPIGGGMNIGSNPMGNSRMVMGQNNINAVYNRLLDLFEKNPSPTMDEMQNSLHCDKQTIERIVEDLKRSNKIYTINGYNYNLTDK